MIRFLFILCCAIALMFGMLTQFGGRGDALKILTPKDQEGFVAKAFDAPAVTTEDLMVQMYWETRHGQTVNVAPGYLFETGDNIQIGVTSKRDGYFYIVVIDDKGVNVIYPFIYDKHTRKIRDNHISAGKPIMTPSENEFGQLRGMGAEKIYVIYSSDDADNFSQGLKRVVELGGEFKDTDTIAHALLGEIQKRAVLAKDTVAAKGPSSKDCTVHALAASGPSPLIMQFTLERN